MEEMDQGNIGVPQETQPTRPPSINKSNDSSSKKKQTLRILKKTLNPYARGAYSFPKKVQVNVTTVNQTIIINQQQDNSNGKNKTTNACFLILLKILHVLLFPIQKVLQMAFAIPIVLFKIILIVSHVVMSLLSFVTYIVNTAITTVNNILLISRLCWESRRFLISFIAKPLAREGGRNSIKAHPS